MKITFVKYKNDDTLFTTKLIGKNCRLSFCSDEFLQIKSVS